MYGLYTGRSGFVGKQEKMASDLVRVLSFLKTKVELDDVSKHAHVNVSSQIDIEWDSKQQEAIEEAEFDSFVTYGYKPRYINRLILFDLESIPSSLDFLKKRPLYGHLINIMAALHG